jgi:hypothetical protein
MFNKVKIWFGNYQKWLFNTPERALDRAYQAALMIKSIEDSHFQGKKVSAESVGYSKSIMSHFENEIKQHLKTIEIRLIEFNSSNSVLIISQSNLDAKKPVDQLGDNSDIFIEKLEFIDQVTAKYKNKSLSLIPVNQKNSTSLSVSEATPKATSRKAKPQDNPLETVSDKTGVLPRSILKTFGRIKQEIDPNSNEVEAEVVQKFRTSRSKTAISIKFLLILVIVPLLTHQLTKITFTPFIEENFFTDQPKITWFQPLGEELENENLEVEIPEEDIFTLAKIEQRLFINEDMQREAWMKLKEFEESLRLKTMVGIIPPLSEAETNRLVREKSEEIVADFRRQSNDALGNIVSGFFSTVAIIMVFIFSRRQIAILKSFLDELVYGLSDSAKAFLIILFTDIFVGYHSPHGWEIILEGIAKHLGLAENRDFNFLFIATFPVILDTVLKYWIFRYLNRISPSAVATYKNMNE